MTTKKLIGDGVSCYLCILYLTIISNHTYSNIKWQDRHTLFQQFCCVRIKAVLTDVQGLVVNCILVHLQVMVSFLQVCTAGLNQGKETF